MPFAPFSADSDVVVINDYNEGNTFVAERRGVLPSGKQRKARYSIDVSSEPMLFDMNDSMLGAIYTDAYAGLIKDQMNGISEVASKATLAMREKAAIAFSRGESWAMKRYAGGRTGPKAPNQSDKLFSDSGRLRDSVSVMQNKTDSTFTINVAANRLNPALLGPRYQSVIDKLISLVPALDPRKARESIVLENALREASKALMAKAVDSKMAQQVRLKMQLRKAQLDALGVFLPGVVMRIARQMIR